MKRAFRPLQRRRRIILTLDCEAHGGGVVRSHCTRSLCVRYRSSRPPCPVVEPPTGCSDESAVNSQLCRRRPKENEYLTAFPAWRASNSARSTGSFSRYPRFSITVRTSLALGSKGLDMSLVTTFFTFCRSASFSLADLARFAFGQITRVYSSNRSRTMSRVGLTHFKAG